MLDTSSAPELKSIYDLYTTDYPKHMSEVLKCVKELHGAVLTFDEQQITQLNESFLAHCSSIKGIVNSMRELANSLNTPLEEILTTHLETFCTQTPTASTSLLLKSQELEKHCRKMFYSLEVSCRDAAQFIDTKINQLS